jgi:hypothetical protein
VSTNYPNLIFGISIFNGAIAKKSDVFRLPEIQYGGSCKRRDFNCCSHIFDWLDFGVTLSTVTGIY